MTDASDIKVTVSVVKPNAWLELCLFLWRAWDKVDHWLPFAAVLAYVHYTPGLTWQVQLTILVPTLPAAASETALKILEKLK